MTTGIVVKPDPAAANAVDDAISQASGAFHRGARQVWLNQRFDVDALTLAAVIATAVPGLGVGTAVVPINPRHPLLVASAAQTAQAAAHGNVSLRIGLCGNELEQRAFGIPAGKEVTRLREYLTILGSIRDDGEVDFQGQELAARPPLSPPVTGGRPFPVYVAAMGPRALRAAGELADGTVTYLAGPRSIAELIAHTLARAAAGAAATDHRVGPGCRHQQLRHGPRRRGESPALLRPIPLQPEDYGPRGCRSRRRFGGHRRSGCGDRSAAALPGRRRDRRGAQPLPDPAVGLAGPMGRCRRSVNPTHPESPCSATRVLPKLRKGYLPRADVDRQAKGVRGERDSNYPCAQTSVDTPGLNGCARCVGVHGLPAARDLRLPGQCPFGPWDRDRPVQPEGGEI